MSVRLQISAMVFMHVQPILFGAGLLVILLITNRDAMATIPVMIGITFVLSAVIAWLIAPRLRQRYWHAKGIDGDVISG